MAFNPVQGLTMFLSGSGITETDTSIVLTFCYYPSPDTSPPLIVMADFGAVGYATIEPETTLEENISFTGITQNADGSATLTGVTRGLAFQTPYTTDADLKQPHAGAVEIRFTNSGPFYNEFAIKRNDETITGKYTFPAANIPIFGSAPTFTLDEQIIDKKYADDLAIAGAPNGSTIVKGIYQEATQAQEDARTTTGSTGARLTLNPGTQRATKYIDFVGSAGGTDSYAITPVPAVTALADGQNYIFEADVANTGAASLNVATLGAKTIKKYGGKDLDTNDIIASQIVHVVYDLDSDTMQLQTPIAKQQISQGFGEVFGGASAIGTDAYAVTITPAVVAYAAGQQYSFIADVANTGAATFKVGSLAAIDIRKGGTFVLETGDILAGQVVYVEHDGTVFQMISPAASFTTSASPLRAHTLLATPPADTAENTIISAVIPAGLLGTKGGIKFTIKETHSGNGFTATVRLKYGSTTVASITLPDPSTVGRSGNIEGWIINTSATAQDFMTCYAGINGNNNGDTQTNASGTSAVSTTSAVTVSATIQMSNAAMGMSTWAVIELVGGV